MNSALLIFSGIPILLGIIILILGIKSGNFLKELFQAKYAWGSKKFVNVTFNESSTMDKIGIILLGVFLIGCGLFFLIYFR
jgi:hypothetical protein